MKRILIVDDEEPARYELRTILEKHGISHEIHESENAVDALKKISENNYNIIFLDINMPGMNGIELAQVLHATQTVNIIFVTAYNEYAVDAFNVAAIDYILKPIETDRLLESIKRVESRSHTIEEITHALSAIKKPQNHKIVGKKRSSSEKVFLNVEDIVYFKAADTDCYAFLANNERWVVGGTIKGYEEKFSHSFVRIHKSYLVNIDKIESFKYFLAGSYRLKVSGIKEKLSVSRSYVKHFKETLGI